MAHRNLPGTFNGDIYIPQSKRLNSAHVEYTGLGGMHNPRSNGYLHCCMGDPQLTNAMVEGSAPKGFHRSTSDGEIALFRPDPPSLTKAAAEARANSRSRKRQSIREPKAIVGLGALQHSPSKRYVQACSLSVVATIFE